MLGNPWLILLACVAEQAAPYTVPAGSPALRYAPFEEVLAFPDDLHTLEDPTSPSGRRVKFQDPARAILSAQLPEDFNLVEALETLDGWGTTGAIFLQFTEPVDPASFHADNVHLVSLEDDGADIPWEVTWEDDETAAFLVPLTPLAPATRYGLVATEVLSQEGALVHPSQDLGRALEGSHADVRIRQHAPALHQALARTGVASEDATAVLVFTTQSLHEQDQAIATWIDERPVAAGLTSAGPCVDNGSGLRSCPASLAVQAFVDDTRQVPFAPGATAMPTDSWVLDVDVHLPTEGAQEPFPVLIYGHGLGGDRGEAYGQARDLAALGIAVVAIDAPAHGDHPTATSTEDFFWIFQFFGIDPATQRFDVFHLRNNWRVATHDKLQLVDAIRAGFDVDEEGTVDLDGEQIFYAGHSLGGIMGAQLLALDPDVLGADLSVPGGRVTEIVHRSQTFAALVALMSPPGTTEGELARFFAMLQAAVDRGDATNWAPHVLGGHRDVLITMVIDDEVIPNSATRSLARAFGVEHVGPALQEVTGLARDAELPVAGNLEGRTAVLYQYEHKIEDGELLAADHFDAHSNDAAVVQFQHFWQTRMDQDVAELIDPFEALGY